MVRNSGEKNERITDNLTTDRTLCILKIQHCEVRSTVNNTGDKHPIMQYINGTNSCLLQ